MFDIAIILSTLESRKPLLERSIQTWDASFEASGLSGAICIYSEADTEVEYDFDVQHAEIFLKHAPVSGTLNRGHNYMVEHIPAKVYLFTHAEMLFPKATIQTAFEHAQIKDYVAFKAFWLSRRMTDHLRQYPWHTPELLEPFALMDDPGDHAKFYANSNIRSIQRWRSTTTHAMTAENTNKLFPLPLSFPEYGSTDPWHAGARDRLGFSEQTIMEPILFHQWHPRLPITPEIDKLGLAIEALQERFG